MNHNILYQLSQKYFESIKSQYFELIESIESKYINYYVLYWLPWNGQIQLKKYWKFSKSDLPVSR